MVKCKKCQGYEYFCKSVWLFTTKYKNVLDLDRFDETGLLPDIKQGYNARWIGNRISLLLIWIPPGNL